MARPHDPGQDALCNADAPELHGASAGDQLRTMLWKQSKLKRRSPRTTCCEVTSPALFACILLLGFLLSSDDFKMAAIYTTLNLNIGPLLSLFLDTTPAVSCSGTSLENATSGSGVVASLLGTDATCEASDRSVDLSDLSDAINPVLSGPLPAIPIELFVRLGELAGSNLGDENYRLLVSQDSYGALFGNLLTLGHLYFAPATSAVGDFVRSVKATYPALDNVTMTVHEDEAAALDALNENRKSERNWGLVVFNELSDHALNYSIRFNYTTIPNTNQISNFIARGLDKTYQRYHLSGFLSIQRMVDTYFFGELSNRTGVTVRAPSEYAFNAPMPTGEYSQNVFFFAVQFLLPIILTMCQLCPVSLLTKSIVEEKELRLKQTMHIMGLRHSVFVTSWLVSSLTQFLIITLLVSVVCNVFMVKTAFSMVFLFTLLFCTASLAFAFLVSVFFTNAILAAVVTPMLFFAMVLPRYVFFGSNRYEDAGSKTLASLLAPTAYAFGSEILGDYEYSSVGVSTANWGEGDYSFSTSLTMLFIDTIIYFFLGLYLERVIPSRYGRQLQPLFLLDPRWWSPPRPTKEPRARAAAVAPPEAPVEGFEPVPESLRSRDSIEIVGLVKTYGSGKMKKTAVDGLDLSLYESQITCLLGHNGAGKTTTLSVLTGLYTPTAGDCYVFGWSIKRCAQKVYEMMGICPQHDVLWSRLSVLEHLEVYASFKGVPKRRRAAVVEKLCGEIGLWDKRHTLAAALSGGMKRKLSVGCALIGGSRAVLLDEPSSGMDPASRRSLWDLLKRKTAGRVMVLTTHYMDEADLLADRIAVMSVGKLKCYGSSVYLKSRFGLGYTLSMLRVDARRLTDQHGQSTAERAGSDGHATWRRWRRPPPVCARRAAPLVGGQRARLPAPA